MIQQRDSIEQAQSRDQQFNQYRRTRSSKYQLETIVRNSYVTQQTKQKPLPNIYQILFKILKTINTKQLENKRKIKIILTNIQSNYQKIVNQIQDSYQIKLAQFQQNNKIKQVEYQSRVQDKNKIIQQLNKRLENSNQIIKSLKDIVSKNQQNKKINQEQQTVDREQQNNAVHRYQNENKLMTLQIIQLRQQKQRIEKQITDLRISHMQLEQKLKQFTKQNERCKIRIQDSKRQKQDFQLQISNLKQINQQFSYKLNNMQAKNQQRIQVFTSKIKQLKISNQQLSTKLQQQIIKSTKLQKQLSLALERQSKIQIQSSSSKKQKQSISQQIQILQQINKTLIQQQQQYQSQIKTQTQRITILQTKLQQKQRQFMELLTNSKIDEIQNELAKKNKQIIQLKNRIVNISQTYHRKQEQFMQYKRQQMSIIKQNQLKNYILSPAQNLQISNNKIQLQSSDSYDSKDKQQDIQQAQLQIIKCKYGILQKMYLELKKQKQKQLNYIEKIEAVIQTQNYEDQRKYWKQQENQRQSQNDDMTMRNSMSNANPRPLKKKTLSGYDLFMNTQQPKLDISIVADSANYNNKNKSTSNSAINSPAASIYNFNNFITTSQLQKIIRNFNYNNSILHKINTSKFITNPTTKIGFIFQYVCYLQLFFSNLFKNGVVEQLIMGDEMDIRRLRRQDLVDDVIPEEDNKKLEKSMNNGSKYGRQSDSSFLSQSSSKILSNSKMYIANQFSLNSVARAQNSPISRKNKLVFVYNTFSQNLTPKIPKKPMIQKICKIEQQMVQIQNFFTSYSLKPDILSENAQAIQKLSQLSHNKITKLILKLIKQNEIMKNCVNVMLKNQQNITKTNNDIYFGIQTEEQSNNTKPQQNIPEQTNQENNTNGTKQNCNIM